MRVRPVHRRTRAVALHAQRAIGLGAVHVHEHVPHRAAVPPGRGDGVAGDVPHRGVPHQRRATSELDAHAVGVRHLDVRDVRGDAAAVQPERHRLRDRVRVAAARVDDDETLERPARPAVVVAAVLEALEVRQVPMQVLVARIRAGLEVLAERRLVVVARRERRERRMPRDELLGGVLPVSLLRLAVRDPGPSEHVHPAPVPARGAARVAPRAFLKHHGLLGRAAHVQPGAGQDDDGRLHACPAGVPRVPRDRVPAAAVPAHVDGDVRGDVHEARRLHDHRAHHLVLPVLAQQQRGVVHPADEGVAVERWRRRRRTRALLPRLVDFLIGVVGVDVCARADRARRQGDQDRHGGPRPVEPDPARGARLPSRHPHAVFAVTRKPDARSERVPGWRRFPRRGARERAPEPRDRRSPPCARTVLVRRPRGCWPRKAPSFRSVRAFSLREREICFRVNIGQYYTF